MATSIGPLFAALVTAPSEWNTSLLAEGELVLRSQTAHQAWVTEAVSKNLSALLADGRERWVYLAQIIREDGESLYAFATSEERALFIELREIDSIGSKFAAKAVSELGLAGIARLAQGASNPSAKVPGLGPKTLEKIRLGVKAKFENYARIFASARKSGGVSESDTSFVGAPNSGLDMGNVPPLLFQALSKLGLRPSDTARVYQELTAESGEFDALPVGDQLKQMLARWGQSKIRKGSGSVAESEI